MIYSYFPWSVWLLIQTASTNGFGSANDALWLGIRKGIEENLLAATSAIILYTAIQIHYFKVFEKGDELIDLLQDNKELLEELTQEIRIKRELEKSKRRYDETL